VSARPLKPQENRILDQLSRDADPAQEALEHLTYELETSAIARKAFGAELIRLRALRDACRGSRGRLPRAIAERLEACQKAKSFDHLVALADSRNEPQPELDLTP
jgi:hypothetical protein